MSKGSAPVCWYCHQPIGLRVDYIAYEPEVIHPPSGVVVCGPVCPKTPANREVTVRP